MSPSPDLQFYLASRSPRRRELLAQCGLRFECVPADIPEQPAPDETATDYARRIALQKARAAQAPAHLPVIGADTDVVLDGRILGKPRDRDDALAMLLALSEREHEVISAVSVVQGARCESALTITRVHFGRVSATEAAAYWDSGEPADKAGAYAIQGLGARFVRAIHGSYTGVVGLPLHETLQLLARFGIMPA